MHVLLNLLSTYCIVATFSSIHWILFFCTLVALVIRQEVNLWSEQNVPLQLCVHKSDNYFDWCAAGQKMNSLGSFLKPGERTIDSRSSCSILFSASAPLQPLKCFDSGLTSMRFHKFVCACVCVGKGGGGGWGACTCVCIDISCLGCSVKN